MKRKEKKKRVVVVVVEEEDGESLRKVRMRRDVGFGLTDYIY